MNEAFKKIIERLEKASNDANEDMTQAECYKDKMCFECFRDGCDYAIEIVNQIAEKYKNGHFGCNWNGQHEKCNDCCLRGECSHCNTEWFTEHSNSEISNKSDVTDINVGEIEEFCEWKCNAIGFIINPHTKRMFNNDPRMKNVYCNTCGKKIIVAPYQPKGENNV